MTRHWPLFGLRLRTPRLQLALPSTEQLDDLIDVALDGVHDPGYMPFGNGWTDAPRDELPYRSLSYFWSTWCNIRPERWQLEFAVSCDGVVVGTQGVRGEDFPTLREVGTGSWLGRRFHGQGIGTEMRAAVLQLAFAGLGAQYAVSTAYTDNAASRGVSRKLGYREDGVLRNLRRGQPATEVRMRLSREDWEAHRTVPVEIDGLEECREWFTATDGG